MPTFACMCLTICLSTQCTQPTCFERTRPPPPSFNLSLVSFYFFFPPTPPFFSSLLLVKIIFSYLLCSGTRLSSTGPFFAFFWIEPFSVFPFYTLFLAHSDRLCAVRYGGLFPSFFFAQPAPHLSSPPLLPGSPFSPACFCKDFTFPPFFWVDGKGFYRPTWPPPRCSLHRAVQTVPSLLLVLLLSSGCCTPTSLASLL